VNYAIYAGFNLILSVIFLIGIFKIYKGTAYLYTQILNLYAFSLIFISLLVLESGGFYITESFNYSYINGAALLLALFGFFFFFLLKVFIQLLSSIGGSIFRQKKIKSSQKKYLARLVLFTVQLSLLALVVNLLLSPVPFFSDEVTRINFWDYAVFPVLGSVFGETSLPVAIALGVIFNFYGLNNKQSLRNYTLFTFWIYVLYLFLLGHKFSAQILAFFFFWLPFMLNTRPPFKQLLKIIFFGLALGMLYVLYVYSNIDSGIVNEYGGATGGALYRIFILQGHVFWNMFNHLDMLGDMSYENMIWLLNNKLYGLELAMHIVSPGFAEEYLESGLRFTAGFPAFLFATPLLFSVVFSMGMMFFYAAVLVRVMNLINSGSIARLSIYIYILYFFHFGFSMGDFRFLFSIKLLALMILSILIELILLISVVGENHNNEVSDG